MDTEQAKLSEMIFSHDEQGRLVFDGQVYRYLSAGTTEEGLRRADQQAQWLNQCLLKCLVAEREACAQMVETRLEHYPTDIFTAPPPQQHGKTVDACSARAIRAILPSLANQIRARGKNA